MHIDMKGKNANTELKLNKHLPKIIWFALLFSILLYNLVSYLASKGRTPKALPDNILMIVISLSAFTVFVIFWVRSYMMRFVQGNPSKIFLVNMMTWAFVESIALYGLVLSMLSWIYAYCLYFSIPALFLMFVFYPRDQRP